MMMMMKCLLNLEKEHLICSFSASITNSDIFLRHSDMNGQLER